MGNLTAKISLFETFKTATAHWLVTNIVENNCGQLGKTLEKVCRKAQDQNRIVKGDAGLDLINYILSLSNQYGLDKFKEEGYLICLPPKEKIQEHEDTEYILFLRCNFFGSIHELCFEFPSFAEIQKIYDSETLKKWQ